MDQIVKAFRFFPKQKGETGRRRGDIAVDQDVALVKFLHQSLAIDVVERGADAAAEKQQVAEQEAGLPESAFRQVVSGQEENPDQSDHQARYAERGDSFFEEQ